ncbi:hypothetical protein EDD18DRAFT_1327867 [Armillaria luteobubalina]|uniref:Uncharacterized protein n=1 Tax=Armillaria luteobubalina TaxID=153913 RepID=A0AA39USX4_9AGAR|nr:hypothetical protein EDD18DRAFT_1327867 [Armillaria luteobubalina]
MFWCTGGGMKQQENQVNLNFKMTSARPTRDLDCLSPPLPQQWQLGGNTCTKPTKNRSKTGRQAGIISVVSRAIQSIQQTCSPLPRRSWGKPGEFYNEIPYASTVSILAGSWEDCRIMCAGNYIRECSSDVLAPEEAAEINDLPYETQYKTLYMLARRTFVKVSYYDLYELEGTVLRNWTNHIYARRDVVVR